MFRPGFSIIFVAVLATGAEASLIHFTDKAEWEAAVGNFTTITFTEFPATTPVTDHYSDLGITFSTLNFIPNSSGFVNDLWGLHGPDGTRFTFDTPQNWVAVDFPGTVKFDLPFNGKVIATSDLFHAPGAEGLGGFAGLTSSLPFDQVRLFKPDPLEGPVLIDDLHWGAIPSPGALGLFAIGALGARKEGEGPDAPPAKVG